MPTFSTFTDSRDGHVYTTVLMPDGQWWAAENLAWAGAGVDYNNDSANRAIYGRLYTYSEASTGCPTGTRLAGQSDVIALIAACGGDTTAGRNLKAVSPYWDTNTGTDIYGFRALPGGKALYGFLDLGTHANFWGLDPSGSDTAFAFYLRGDVPDAYTGFRDVNLALSVRFIVIPPDAPAFYGNPFEGFESGTVSVEIDRKLTLVDTLGGRPVLIPYAPADKDEWLVTAEFWTSAEQAREIEMRTPPRGAPIYPGISVPARSGENTFAGLAPAATNGSADTYVDPIMLQPLEVLGQKDVRVDLYGYRASFSLSCSSASNPYSSNPATAPTTTPPTWLPNKWRVHSIEDGSNERRVIGPDGKWTGSGNPIAVNQIRPLSIQCDYLTTDMANELVAFFRGIRGNLFNLGFYPGPVGAHAPVNPDFVATKLTCKRDAGLLWSATLEVVAA